MIAVSESRGQAPRLVTHAGRPVPDVVVIREPPPTRKSLPDEGAVERQLGRTSNDATAVQTPQFFNFAGDSQDPILSAR
jgi:hypothetical protein